MHTETLHIIGGKVKITIPENLNELTIGQLIEISKSESELGPLSILSGVSEKELANISQHELEKFTNRILSLSHQIKYCYEGKNIPQYVSFGTTRVKRFGFYFRKENKIKVPGNLSIEPAGAFMASRDVIADEINRHINEFGEDNWQANFQPDLDAIATLLANYFYCRVTLLPYTEQKAFEFKSEILKLPVQVALPIGRHFFFSYPDLSQQKITFFQAVRQNLKKRQALKRLKNSAFIILLITWLAGIS